MPRRAFFAVGELKSMTLGAFACSTQSINKLHKLVGQAFSLSVSFFAASERPAELERGAGNPHRLRAPHYLRWFASIDHREQLMHAAGIGSISRLHQMPSTYCNIGCPFHGKQLAALLRIAIVEIHADFRSRAAA